MWRSRRTFSVSLIVSLLLLASCGREPRPTPTPTNGPGQPAPLAAQTGSAIRALGTIQPAQALQLSFGAGAPIRSVRVRLGTRVTAGQPLAELDTAQWALELENARQDVAYAQAALASLTRGADPALVERAEAEHARQVAEAEIALRVAGQKLAQAQCPDPASDVLVAQAEASQAKLELEQARAGSPAATLAVARVNLARAVDVLSNAQDEYRKALDRPWEPQQIRDGLAKAIQSAEWDVEAAQAQLEDAERAETVHRSKIEALQVGSDIAEVHVAQALDTQAAYSVTLELLAADVALAELRLNSLKAWQNPLLDPPGADRVAQATARLRQAEIAVEQLQRQMDRATLRAPFDGAVSAVYAHPGEWSSPGAPVVEIVDMGHWYVETRNVGELSIGRVREGQRAVVQVLAFDKAEVEGTVAAISPVAVVQQGDTTYTLIIDLESTALDLRPGMNAQVEIQVE